MPKTDLKILADIKSDVCDTVLMWTLVVGVTAVALSLLRIIEFGFLPVMALHVCLSAALSIIYLIRRRLHFNVRAGAVVAVMMAIAIGGHLSFGTPTRIAFFIAASIMATVFFGERAGILIAAVSVAILGLIYAGFMVGAVPPPIPAPALSATNWIANAASMVVASIAPLIAVSRYRVYLERERQRVIAADRAKSDFLATMSHELRTPMTAILGVADLLLSDKSAEHVRDKVFRISRAGRLLLDLLNDLLDYSKIDSNTIVAKPAPFNPKALIEEICQLFTPLAAEKGVVLNAVIAPWLPENLLADWGRLRQAILNLVGNAVKFTERGSITARASADRRESGVILAVEVTDTGIGISQEQQEKLFQPFMQADQGATRR